jgi:hypothetical protein
MSILLAVGGESAYVGGMEKPDKPYEPVEERIYSGDLPSGSGTGPCPASYDHRGDRGSTNVPSVLIDE